VFIGLAFILQIMVGRSRVPTSVLDAAAPPPATAPATGTQAAPLTPIVPPSGGDTSKLPPAGKQP
jgi:hypothetical protein